MRNRLPVLLASPLTTALAVVLAGAPSAQGSVELAVNGDFSDGNVGFSTQYVYTPGTNTAAGQYHVLADASTWNRWFRCYDHTTGSGLFMAINGASTVATAWSQTAPVTPGATYTLRFWYATIDTPRNSPARLQALVNGAQIGGVVTPGGAGAWAQFTATWDSGSAATATIEIKDLTTASSGNDFGLDDISFTGPCPGVVTAYGTGLPGAGGATPVLTGSGCAARGRDFAFDLSNGRGGAQGMLLIGFQRAAIPFLGGTLLVAPNVTIGIALGLDGTPEAPGDGSASVPVTVPDELGLLGLEVDAQGFVLDAAAVQGVAMSGALAVTIG